MIKERLDEENISSDMIIGKMKHNARNKALKKFKRKSAKESFYAFLGCLKKRPDLAFIPLEILHQIFGFSVKVPNKSHVADIQNWVRRT